MSTTKKESTKTENTELMKPEFLSSELAEQLELGKIFVDSQLLPEGIDSPQKAFLLMQQGRELGLDPMQSINNIAVIKGKTSISANMMRALVLRSKIVTYKVTKHTDDVCEYVFTRDGVEYPPVSFTMEEAKRAGLTGGVNWSRYPKDMLSARAFARGARLYCSDIIQGMYTLEEMQDEEEFDKKGDANKVGIRETIKQVFEGIKRKVLEAKNDRDLETVAKQIRKNAGLKLISVEDQKELVGLLNNKREELGKVVEGEVVEVKKVEKEEAPKETEKKEEVAEDSKSESEPESEPEKEDSEKKSEESPEPKAEESSDDKEKRVSIDEALPDDMFETKKGEK